MSKLKDLAKTVAKYAPLLGSLLPVPGGAAIGAVVASAFNGDADKPDELINLVNADPNAAIKLREIESNNKVALEALAVKQAENALVADTARIESVNLTMRAETTAGDLWTRRWRPAWGFTAAAVFALQMVVIFYAVVFKTSQASAIILAIAGLDIFWSVPLAILGISAFHRGKLKRTLAGEKIQPLINLAKK